MLGISVEDVVVGVIELFDLEFKEYLWFNISVKGYSLFDFVCFLYGGVGFVYIYGYIEGLGFKDVVVFVWVVGFSVFGCVCVDFEYRYDKSVDIVIL